VQPGERVAFPYLADDVQRLVIVQGSSAWTIRADLTATFDPGTP
jgi:exosome complex RNA-binding protein Rrp42 (RNase PH superfamily)